MGISKTPLYAPLGYNCFLKDKVCLDVCGDAKAGNLIEHILTVLRLKFGTYQPKQKWFKVVLFSDSTLQLLYSDT